MTTRSRARRAVGSSTSVQLLLSMAAVVFALLAGALVLVVTGQSPREAYGALWQGAFGSRRSIGETLLSTTPLIFGGLAVTVAFRCGLFNMGVEGQIAMGGLGAAWAGYWIRGLPACVHLPLALLIGTACGTAWGSIAGYLKARLNMHEVITTIMLNYIAFNIAGWAVSVGGPMKDAGQLPASPIILQTAKLPRILPGSRLHAGILIALVFVAIIWYLLFYSRLGYAIRAVGLSPTAAEYGGIRIARHIMLTMAISGSLGGLAGAVEVLGVHYRLFEAFSPGYGWDAIAVALLGMLHPMGVLLSALLFGALRSGSTLMQTVAGVSRDMILVISALVIFFIALTRSFAGTHGVSPGGKDSAGVAEGS